MNKIGFRHDTDAEIPEEAEEEAPLSQDTLDDILDTLFTQPDWLGNYEQTLFWACVFNTQNKEHQC